MFKYHFEFMLTSLHIRANDISLFSILRNQFWILNKMKLQIGRQTTVYLGMFKDKWQTIILNCLSSILLKMFDLTTSLVLIWCRKVRCYKDLVLTSKGILKMYRNDAIIDLFFRVKIIDKNRRAYLHLKYIWYETIL